MDTSTYDLQLKTIELRVKQTFCCYPPFSSLLFLALGPKAMSGSMNTGEFVHNRIDVGMNDAYGSQPSLRCDCWDFWASLVAQLVKNLPTVWETGVQSLGREDPLEKELATHSSTLAWKIQWTEEPGRLQSVGSWGVRHDWATSLSLSLMCF